MLEVLLGALGRESDQHSVNVLRENTWETKAAKFSENWILPSPLSWEFLSAMQPVRCKFVFHNLRSIYLRNHSCHTSQRQILAFPVRQNKTLWSSVWLHMVPSAVPVPWKKCQWCNRAVLRRLGLEQLGPNKVCRLFKPKLVIQSVRL